MPSHTHHPDHLSPLERQLIAYGACLPFLDPIRPIVADIRQRHGIGPPICRADLAANLRQHPPEALLSEVLDALRTVEWPAPVSFVNYICRPELAIAWLQDKLAKDTPFDVPDDLLAALRPLADIFLSMIAEPLVRYIVVGPMEVPQPIPSDFVQTAFAIDLFGERLVIAIAGASADPRMIAREFVQTYNQAFGLPAPPRRPRVAEQYARDAWVWAAYEDLKAEKPERLRRAETSHEPLTDVSIYALIADLHSEVFPREAPGRPYSKQREQYITRLIPTLRQARHRFQERFFEAPDPPELPPTP
jgi:hypothetical protein